MRCRIPCHDRAGKRVPRGILALALLGLISPACQRAGAPTPVATAAGGGTVQVVGNARFTLLTPECIRMEYAPDGRFVDAPSLFAASRGGQPPERAVRSPDRIVIAGGRMRLEYLDNGQPFSPDNLRVTIQSGDSTVEWRPGAAQTGNLGGAPGQAPTSGSLLGAGLLSRDGWYLIDDSATPLMVGGRPAARPTSGSIDWFLFGYGTDYKAGLRALAAVAGRPPLPPRAALGVWCSLAGDCTAYDFSWTVEQFDALGLPLDVVAIEGDAQAPGWNWGERLAADAPALLGWLHERNLLVARGLRPWTGVAPGDAASLDRAIAPLEAQGVDCWRLEGRPAADQTTVSLPGAGDAMLWLNDALDRRAEARDARRAATLGAWAGWGDQRHPLHALFEAAGERPLLGMVAPLASAAGNAGAFFGAPGVGRIPSASDAESDLRWAQLASLSAVMRLSWTREADPSQPPWSLDPTLVEAMQPYLRLRSTLFPYLYTMAWKGYRDALPPLRPLYLEHADREEAYDNPQEYYLGDDLVCAPIARAGVGPGWVAWQRVWLPPGRWYHFLTGERYEGGRTMVAVADYTEMPLYARGGVPIPMQPYAARMGSAPLGELTVRAYPGEIGSQGRSVLYEDDGRTRDYRSGRYATTPLVYERTGDRITVTIGPTQGEYRGQPARRAYTIELPGMTPPREVTVNGRPAVADFDPAGSTLRVRVASRSIRQAVTVTLAAVEAAPGTAENAAFARRLEAIAPGREFGGFGEFSAQDMRDGTAEAILALFGVAVVENETAWPSPGVLRRVVSTGSRAWMPATNVRVDYEWRRGTDGSGELVPAARLDDEASVGPVAAPPDLPAGDGSDALELTRILSFQLGLTTVQVRHSIERRPAETGD
jgi:hypothetical protein